MSGFEMRVDFFGKSVRAKTEGNLICLNDLFWAGNAVRVTDEGKPSLQLANFLSSKTLEDYVAAASEEWGIPQSELIQKGGRGRTSATYAHVSVALLAAEQLSVRFHVHVHRVFIEGKLLEFRQMGGTEFISLNASIDKYLPEREGKDSNRGVYINVAKALRTKILGVDAEADAWAIATVEQTHRRFEIENKLCDFLRLGMIRNYEHLKDIIARL